MTNNNNVCFADMMELNASLLKNSENIKLLNSFTELKMDTQSVQCIKIIFRFTNYLLWVKVWHCAYIAFLGTLREKLVNIKRSSRETNLELTKIH